MTSLESISEKVKSASSRIKFVTESQGENFDHHLHTMSAAQYKENLRRKAKVLADDLKQFEDFLTLQIELQQTEIEFKKKLLQLGDSVAAQAEYRKLAKERAVLEKLEDEKRIKEQILPEKLNEKENVRISEEIHKKDTDFPATSRLAMLRRTMLIEKPPRLEDYGISDIGMTVLGERNKNDCKRPKNESWAMPDLEKLDLKSDIGRGLCKGRTCDPIATTNQAQITPAFASGASVFQPVAATVAPPSDNSDSGTGDAIAELQAKKRNTTSNSGSMNGSLVESPPYRVFEYLRPIGDLPGQLQFDNDEPTLTTSVVNKSGRL